MIITKNNHIFKGSTTDFIVKNDYELRRLIEILHNYYGYGFRSMGWILNRYKTTTCPMVRALNNVKSVIITNRSYRHKPYKSEVILSYKDSIY